MWPLKQWLRSLGQTVNAFRESIYFPPYHAPDDVSVAEMGFGTLAAPLPRSAMEDARWFRDWFTPFRTAAQHSRAECAQQPTNLNCIYADNKATTIRRRVPRVATPEPERAPNDYDHLIDGRVLSPNNRMVGFRDYDRDEIACENAMSPLPTTTPEPPTPSPIPAEGSLQAMMYPSLVDNPHAPTSRRRPAPSDLTTEELGGFVRRFRALPYESQQEVQRRATRGRMGWMAALEIVEEKKKRFDLLPSQREVYDKVKIMQQRAKLLFESAEVESEEQSREFHWSVVFEWSQLGGPLEIQNVLGKLFSDGEETMFGVRDGQEEIEELYGQGFFLEVVKLVDEQGLDASLRQQAVQKIHCLKRLENRTCIAEDIDDWFAFVGDRRKELRGIYKKGDFWSSVLEEWETLVYRAETEYCLLDDLEAREISVEAVRYLIKEVNPVKRRTR